ncbi:MAG: glycosyltransferase family 10 [Planctomycetota bacterium]
MSDHPTIGLFVHGSDDADCFLWQANGPCGLHHPAASSAVQFLPRDASADHVLVVTDPRPLAGLERRPWHERKLGRLRGSERWSRAEAHRAWDTIDREPSAVTLLVYEPPGMFSDTWFSVARERCAIVAGPDPRCSHQIRLPATWWIDDPPNRLLAERREDVQSTRPIRLACITSGRSELAGHRERLAFLAAVQEAGIDVAVFGRGLPASLKPRGSLRSKSFVLGQADYTIAIENYADGDRYVTEKLFDPLLCWSVPIYFGSEAATSMIPAKAFVRLPSLDCHAVERIRSVIHDHADRTDRLDAISAARADVIKNHNLLTWACGLVLG